MTEEKKFPIAASDRPYGSVLSSIPDDKYQLSITQKSGLSSDAQQSQNVYVGGSHYHADKATVYRQLVSIHENGITIDPTILRNLILTIDDGIREIDDHPIDFTTGICIEKKNELNNHSTDYFEQYVEIDFYPQFYKLDRFFALKENQKTLQPKVDKIIKTLSMQIHAFQGAMPFEAVLLRICTVLIERHHEQLQGKDNEILLILYYFYCNCCIGKKTEEEKNAGS